MKPKYTYTFKIVENKKIKAKIVLALPRKPKRSEFKLLNNSACILTIKEDFK